MKQQLDQVARERDCLESQVRELSGANLLNLRQERQEFDEIKMDISRYIQTFKKNFFALSIRSSLHQTGHAALVFNGMFNELYDILTTTEKSLQGKQGASSFVDDFGLEYAGQQLVYAECEDGGSVLRQRSYSESKTAGMAGKSLRVHTKAGDYQQLILQRDEEVRRLKQQKEIEFQLMRNLMLQMQRDSRPATYGSDVDIELELQNPLHLLEV